MTIISRYTNGNCGVTLYSDGTKERVCDGDPIPEMPESIDLKITDWCDGGCEYCHEGSSESGKHANPDIIFEVLIDARAGMEVAIGGGDPLSHPRLEQILSWMRGRDLIANLTVNASKMGWEGEQQLMDLRRRGLIRAVGMSGYLLLADPNVLDDNTVLHRIVGVDDPIHSLEHHKILILGFKRRGRGASYNEKDMDRRIAEWRFWTPHLLSLVRGQADAVVGFDNLALEQLGVRELVPDDVWRDHYMGDDGRFTMFFDAVTDKFAASSMGKRRPRNNRTLKEMFDDVRIGT